MKEIVGVLCFLLCVSTGKAGGQAVRVGRSAVTPGATLGGSVSVTAAPAFVTFQLVPHRWKGKTGVMTGIIGAAGGIGGFYLPVIMGIAKESTGSYQLGFATFGVLAALAFILVATLHRQWLTWALPSEPSMAIDGAVAMAE